MADHSEGFQDGRLIRGMEERFPEKPHSGHHLEDFAVWSDTHQINSFEVDPFQRATIQTLCKRMQEAAWNHADALSLGYVQMRKRGLVWVLCRLKVAIRDFPIWGETIRVRTWPTGVHRLFALREFQISNPGEAILA